MIHLILVVSAIFAATPVTTAVDDDWGYLPRAEVSGRIVDAHGIGVRGVEISARAFDEGMGVEDWTRVVATTGRDGSWRWSAPTYVVLTLAGWHRDYAAVRGSCHWLRPGQSYDFGEWTMREADLLRFRVVSSSRRIVRHGRCSIEGHIELHCDADGWYSARLGSDDLLGWEIPGYEGESHHSHYFDRGELRVAQPFELRLEHELHCVVEVRYPDRTPVANAIIFLEGDRTVTTDGLGRANVLGSLDPATELRIRKGDYETRVQVGPPNGGRRRCTMPRGGDVEFVLTCDKPAPPPLGWWVTRGEGEREGIVGRTRTLIENLKPGPHVFHLSMFYGDSFEPPEPRSVTVAAGELSRLEFPLVARPMTTARIEVRDQHGKPVPEAWVEAWPYQVRTNEEGIATLTFLPSEDGIGITELSVWHERVGFVDTTFAKMVDGVAVVQLTPWAVVECRLIDADGIDLPTAKFSVRSTGTYLHVRHFHGEPPLAYAGAKSTGTLVARFRPRKFWVEVSTKEGWTRREVVTLTAGERELVEWVSPGSRTLEVEVRRGSAPVGGSVSTVRDEKTGWSYEVSEKLDGEGRASIVVPASEELEVRWYDGKQSASVLVAPDHEGPVVIEVPAGS